MVYGYLVAADDFGSCYVVPMVPALEQMKSALGAIRMSLDFVEEARKASEVPVTDPL